MKCKSRDPNPHPHPTPCPPPTTPTAHPAPPLRIPALTYPRSHPQLSPHSHSLVLSLRGKHNEMLAHHLAAFLLAVLGVAYTYLLYYAPFFMGVVEL